MRLMLLTALAIFALDQVSKYLVVIALDLATLGEFEVFPPYLVFRMAWNYGVNFGLFAGGDATRWILIAVALAISAWVVTWARREGGKWVFLSAGFLLGGALGNVVDRVIYGAVADFLNMSCCGIDNPFSFNVADIAIFVGAVGLILFTGKNPRDGRRGLR